MTVHEPMWTVRTLSALKVETRCSVFVAVFIYRLVMISIDLSKKFTSHVQMVTGSVDLIVTQLLCYHMPLLYCMQPFNSQMYRVTYEIEPNSNECMFMPTPTVMNIGNHERELSV